MIKIENNIKLIQSSPKLDKAIQAMSSIITDENIQIVISGTLENPQVWTSTRELQTKKLIEAHFRLNFWG